MSLNPKDLEQESRLLTPRDSWHRILTLMQADGTKSPILEDLSIKGWKVDAQAFLELKNTELYTIPLQPARSDDLWLWNDGAKAERQLQDWKKKFDGDVVYLIVSDRDQSGALKRIAQPVKKAWLTDSTMAELFDRYDAFEKKPDQLMIRVAIIARTGRQPEELRP